MLLAWPVAIFVLRDRPDDVGQTVDGVVASPQADGSNSRPQPSRRCSARPRIWLLLVGERSIDRLDRQRQLPDEVRLRRAGLHRPGWRDQIWSTARRSSLARRGDRRTLDGRVSRRSRCRGSRDAGHLCDRRGGHPTLCSGVARNSRAFVYLVRRSVFGASPMGADYMLIPLMAARICSVCAAWRARDVRDHPVRHHRPHWFPNLIAQLRGIWGGYGSALWVACAIAAAGAPPRSRPCRATGRDMEETAAAARFVRRCIPIHEEQDDQHPHVFAGQ